MTLEVFWRRKLLVHWMKSFLTLLTFTILSAMSAWLTSFMFLFLEAFILPSYFSPYAHVHEQVERHGIFMHTPCDIHALIMWITFNDLYFIFNQIGVEKSNDIIKRVYYGVTNKVMTHAFKFWKEMWEFLREKV